ncbi:MAG: Fur family transcriptional regulator [Thermoanaerobaculia bacterium]
MERTAAAVRRMVDQMIVRCREAGMNVTPQRLAIYEALVKSETHPTPEMLFKRVKRSMPSLSLATIYKSLDALENLGLIQAVEIDSDSRRYDANMSRHHHLVCTRCRSVTDFYDEKLDHVKPCRPTRGFIPHSITVKVLGLCAACAKSRR